MRKAGADIALPSKWEAVCEKSRRDFAYFVKQAWPHVEPEALQWNWHLDLKCDKLQAVTRGDIRRLVIEEPPGFAKSMVTSVLWHAWEWLQYEDSEGIGGPSLRAHYLSGSDSVKNRDSRRCRNLIKSDWYQRMRTTLGHDWTLQDDLDQKTHFGTTEHGERMSDVIGGKVTGDRADKQVIDDPYDVKEATRGTRKRIKQRMQEVVADWDDVLADRLNDEANNPRVLIMQRLDPDDLAGRLEERDEYEIVKVRQEYDPDHDSHPDYDPREERGDLAFPQRITAEVVEERKKSSIYEATNNQQPEDRDGGIYFSRWFYSDPQTKALRSDRVYRRGELPAVSDFDFVAQTWDFSKGATEPDSSYSVGHIIGYVDATYWLFPIEKREQAGFRRMQAMVEELSEQHPDVTRRIVEPKASGPEVVSQLEKKIGGFIEFEPDGAKDVRADIASEPCETGDFMIPHPSHAGPWVRSWVEEVVGFPGSHDDRVDAWSQFVLYRRDREESSGGYLGSIQY